MPEVPVVRRVGWVLLASIVLSPVVCAGGLDYSLQLEQRDLRKNIRAWLGDAPADARERARFLATADQRIRQSLQALGYYQPTVDIQLDKSAEPWQAVISVTPNEPVCLSRVTVQVFGPASDNPDFVRLLAELPLAEGDIFHHGAYEELKRSILSLGQRQGYFDGEFTVHEVKIAPSLTTAQLDLQYRSGQRYRFGSLVNDVSAFDTQLLAALRPFSEGDYFELALLQQFQARIQQTRFFSSVLVRPLIDDAVEWRIPLSIKLQPANTHSFDVGAGYSTDTRERFSVVWRSPRLNRHGHSQETRIEYSPVNPSGRFTYNIPLTHPLDDILQFGARLEDNEFGDVNSLQRELSVRREARTAQAWVRSVSLRALNESWDVNKEHWNQTYWLPGVTLSHKQRQGKLVDPAAGLSQLYRLEGGSENLGSDIDLLRVYTRFTLVTTLASRHRVVARTELGAVWLADGDRENLAPSLGFFTGGAQSLRGFGYQSLGNEVAVITPDGEARTLTVGGDRLVTASLEYQYYVDETWRGALFFDAGDAFDQGEFELNYGAGFGIHYLTPVGAIKLEIANSLSADDPEWRLHLNIGAEF